LDQSLFLLRGDDPVLAVLASIPLTAVLTPALTRKFHHDRSVPEKYIYAADKERFFIDIFRLKGFPRGFRFFGGLSLRRHRQSFAALRRKNEQLIADRPKAREIGVLAASYARALVWTPSRVRRARGLLRLFKLIRR